MPKIRIYVQKIQTSHRWVDLVITSREADGTLKTHMGMGTLQEGDAFTVSPVSFQEDTKLSISRGRRDNLKDELQDIQDRLVQIRLELQAKEE